MTLVLDAGAFIAVERGERRLAALIKRESLAGRTPVTHGGIVGQVWRGGGERQAELARLLDRVEVTALDRSLGRRAGMLLAVFGGADTIDAAVICPARDGDDILTADPDDLAVLAEAADLHVKLIPV